MKEKLQLLMERLQLKPGQFARILDINPAIISHILAERNKPGVDLLQKILSKFPQVSPDWLLLNSGEMFRSVPQNKTSMTPEVELQHEHGSAQSQKIIESKGMGHTLFASDTPQSDIKTNNHPDNASNVNTTLGAIADRSLANKPVIRIVLFYADSTFESFIPNNFEQ